MNKKLILTLFSAFALAFGFASCGDDEKVSYMPTWKGFVYTPTSPAPGDSLHVRAAQAEIGHLIYRATYNWTATCLVFAEDGAQVDSTFTYGPHKVVYDNEPGDPEWHLLIPAQAVPGAYLTIQFQGEYDYSATGVYGTDGTLASDGYAGSLRRNQSGTLKGTSRGSVRLQIGSPGV